MKSEQDITAYITRDQLMVEQLRAVQSLGLPDWWIGAGFVRNRVWDVLHGYTTYTPLNDIDVIYFDPHDYSDAEALHESTKMESQYERELQKIIPDVSWSVTNQARMHVFHNHKPYTVSVEGLAQWVETATCIGVRLDASSQVILTTPFGITDLVNLLLRFNTTSGVDEEVFHERIKKKEWLRIWPKLRVVT